eukprot:SAG11_NODE_13161_length_667_cov_0.859155_1_plen_28_part_10
MDEMYMLRLPPDVAANVRHRLESGMPID